MKTLIKNGRVVTAVDDYRADVLIENEKVSVIGASLQMEADQTIDANIYSHYTADEVLATPVDPSSIMMYPIPKAWTLDGFSTAMNDDLSETDRDLIRIAYPW